jgi:hypothetical protein
MYADLSPIDVEDYSAVFLDDKEARNCFLENLAPRAKELHC